jgi:RIO kinase 1
MERLQHLLDEGIIDEVFQQLKTGKEAEVWLVSHRGVPVAAKLYKEREFRSFKNDAGYREGRQVRNTRTQRAMDKGTAFGRRAAEEAWKSAEANALYALHAAGVRVPKPVLFYEGVLLMEVIGDAEGRVAPRLVEAGITKEQAAGLYAQLRGEVVKMLAADLIHSDLSEFNILLGVDGPVIIDFPQVVEAARNSRSEHFFRRDLGNLVRFFSLIDPALARHQSDADEIWRAYTRRELTADFVPTGRSAPRPPHQQHQGHQQHPPRHGRPDGHGRRDERRDDRRGGPPAWKQARDDQKPRGPNEQRPPRAPSDQRPPRGPNEQRPPRGPNEQRPPRGPNDQRPPRGPNDQRPPRGPEVSFKGQGPAQSGRAPPSGPSQPGAGGGRNDRRRRPRRW